MASVFNTTRGWNTGSDDATKKKNPSSGSNGWTGVSGKTTLSQAGADNATISNISNYLASQPGNSARGVQAHLANDDVNDIDRALASAQARNASSLSDISPDVRRSALNGTLGTGAKTNVTNLSTTVNNGGGGGGGNRYQYANVNYGDGSGSINASLNSTGMINDYLAKMKAILDSEKEQRDNATESRYKAMLGLADRNFDAERNEIARQNAYTNRWLNQTYGGNLSGAGLTNRLRAQTNYNNNLNQAMINRDSARTDAETERYNNLADAVNQYADRYNGLATNLYNTELSNDMQRYQNQLDLEYRKYIASLGL